jgi:hypothetical protein
MSWQKCPICEGTGVYNSISSKCPTCEGKRIISELNGLPPGEIKSPSQIYDQLWIQPSDVKSYSNKEEELKTPSILSPVNTTFSKSVINEVVLSELGITPEEKNPYIVVVRDIGNEKLINSHAQEIANDSNIPSITKPSRFYDRLISFDLVTGSFTDLETYLIDKLNKYLDPNNKLKISTTQNPTQDVSNIQSGKS